MACLNRLAMYARSFRSTQATVATSMAVGSRHHVSKRSIATLVPGALETMEIRQVPILDDNYVYLLRDVVTKEVVVVDPGEAGPVIDAMDELGWDRTKVSTILNTHHHYDHTDGNAEIREATGAQVVGPLKDAYRLDVDVTLEEGSTFSLLGMPTQVIETPGHTSGHISLFVRCGKESSNGAPLLLCGDTLFSLGCGRLFEGTAAQLYQSIKKFDNLPDNTLVVCAHEYTTTNLKFCLSVDGNNPDLVKRGKIVKERRTKGLSTVPSRLGEERQTNVFLRAGCPTINEAIGLDRGADSLAAFTELRKRRDTF